jgi:hypothetical protein
MTKDQAPGALSGPEVIEIFLIRNRNHAKKYEKEERESCRLFCKGSLCHFV